MLERRVLGPHFEAEVQSARVTFPVEMGRYAPVPLRGHACKFTTTRLCGLPITGRREVCACNMDAVGGPVYGGPSWSEGAIAACPHDWQDMLVFSDSTRISCLAR